LFAACRVIWRRNPPERPSAEVAGARGPPPLDLRATSRRVADGLGHQDRQAGNSSRLHAVAWPGGYTVKVPF
jgi:hypothetical protein